MKEPPSLPTSTGFRQPTLNEIDKLTRLVMPVGYSWPASGLIGYDMAKLHELKARTGKPVTQLLREAVEMLYESTSADDSPPITMAKPAEKRTNVIEPMQPVVEAYLTTAKRRVQRTLFSDSNTDTVICAEPDSPSE